MKKPLIIVFSAFVLLFTLIYLLNPFRPVSSDKRTEIFVVSEGKYEASVIKDLKDKGFIRSFIALDLVLTIKGEHDKVQPGGYYLSKSMDTFEIADKISKSPDMKWITFPEGLRKEQIGERLQKLLVWSDKELNDWNQTYTAMTFDNFEGVYFPDTYLIPVDESGFDIAKRMIARFNEVLGPQIDGFSKKDILWTTGIKIASLVQREAGGKNDMALIAGILWNRLEKGQRLEIDATVQYAKGKVGDSWWAPVSGSDTRNIVSPYNTYKNKGLPPHPIANPGVNAVNAALNPEETDCMFYLHDRKRQIHCAVTYEQHLKNIEIYLK
jgi:UPF0755 protein